ncbi:MAG: hypothetical protein NZ898_11185 [Myxococcota bacterium]|nr:hypothetical protein [Myxococcota bacterium]MDW8362273.1 hypothetical protein [Myxococcales bacterium]
MNEPPSTSGGRPEARPAYEGAAGRTCVQRVLVPDGDGLRAVEVPVCVNAATHPELAAAAISGTLHRLDDGLELALPFVFHDPGSCRFALVLPASLAHRELEERARLLERLASDGVDVPPYVREARVVVGAAGLRAYLEEPPGGLQAARVALETRQADLVRLQRELAEQEARLLARERRLESRAEEVTTREDELRTRFEELEAAERDLAMRLQELEERQAGVQAAEAALARERAELDAMRGRIAVEAARLAAVSGREATATTAASATSASVGSSRPSVRPAAAVPNAQDTAAGLNADHEPRARDASAGGGFGSEGADDEVEEIDEVMDLDDAVEAEVTGVGAGPPTDEHVLDEGRTAVADAAAVESAGRVSPHAAPAPVVPPTSFLADRDVEMAATLVQDEAWLFVRLPESQRDAFRTGADLLVQWVNVSGRAVVLLTLVEEGAGRPATRRAALDPFDPADRSLLERLSSRFVVHVAFFSHEGRYERSVRIQAEREPNVALVLERTRGQGGSSRLDAETARQRALSVPPPVRETGLPFSDEEPLLTARQTLAAVARLGEWAVPERMDRALLVLSVPRGRVESAFRRVLEAAFAHGVPLPQALLEESVRLGLAADVPAAVSRLVEGLDATIRRPDRGGLDEAELASASEALLAAAAEHDVVLDAVVHERMWNLVHARRGPESGAELGSHPAGLRETSREQLVVLLDHPRLRRSAALELCRRGDPAVLDVLYRAVRKMPRSDVVRIVPRIVAFGELAADALIDGLGARKTFVRQASALALGQLRLRRAITPLLQLLETEPSEVWREVARVLGEMGAPVLRAAARNLREPRGDRDRLALLLAHLHDHGCERAVDELAADPDPGVAEIARKSLLLREEAARARRHVRGLEPIDRDDVVLAFSRRFLAELAGDAPDEDLADVPERAFEA